MDRRCIDRRAELAKAKTAKKRQNASKPKEDMSTEEKFIKNIDFKMAKLELEGEINSEEYMKLLKLMEGSKKKLEL